MPSKINCSVCGAERIVSPAVVKRYAPPAIYRCKPCSVKQKWSEGAYDGRPALKPRAVIAVDPGSPITMAIVDEHGKLLRVSTPQMLARRDPKTKSGWNNVPERLARLLARWAESGTHDLYAVVEAVSSRGNEARQSSDKLVGSMWMAHGVFAMWGLKTLRPHPFTWKTDMGLTRIKKAGKGYVDPKDAALMLARKNWPEKTSSYFKYKKQHNNADAALLALWGVQHGTWFKDRRGIRATRL